MTFRLYIPPTTEEGKRAERIVYIERNLTDGRLLSGYLLLQESLDRWPGSADLLAVAAAWQRKARSRAIDLGSQKATEMSNETHEWAALEGLLKRIRS